MATSRPSTRSTAREADIETTPVRADRAARGVSVEEGFLPEVDVLPRPTGFGTEATTSSTDPVLLDSYQVPADHVARLSELALSISSNGQASVTVSGVQYGPFTGATDVSIPLQNGVLPPGYRVEVWHESTDGSDTTTRATVVALEV
jgi:hypothetical protein